MKDPKIAWRLRLPLVFGSADLAWSFSALRPVQSTNAAASVGMINSVIWIFLHLPAALLGSLPFGSPGSPGLALPMEEILLLGVLGILQMAAIGWGIGLWLDKRNAT